ncbi:VWA domain-containing protein [Bacillus tianshenii]|nr:VWA domain-containing protein [Bacillus tianshenii]
MKRLHLILITGSLLLLLSACFQNTDNAKQQSKETPIETTTDKHDSTTPEEKIQQLKAMLPEGVDKIPQTAEEFIAFPEGPFSGEGFDEKKHGPTLDELPVIEGADDEVMNLYFLVLLSMFSEKYPDPQPILDRINSGSVEGPNMEDPGLQFKEHYNVEIILDASGSMGAVSGGKTKMTAAKEAVQRFASSLPKEANVALRVYGHKGSSAEKDKALSCKSSELVYDLQPYDETNLKGALSEFQPTGYTPIAHSLQEASKDLKDYSGENSTNIIYLVSDGIETCDGDPVKAAKQLADSQITPIVNVIGFDMDPDGAKQLQNVAQAAGGQYASIKNQQELENELEKAKEEAEKWYRWKTNASNEVYNSNNDIGWELMDFHNEWINTKDDIYDDLYAITHYFSNNDSLSDENVDELRELITEYLDKSDEVGSDLKEKLWALKDKSHNKKIKEIHDLYDNNVPD